MPNPSPLTNAYQRFITYKYPLIFGLNRENVTFAIY